MSTPLTRKANRHAIRRVQLPQRPPPDTEAEKAQKEAAKAAYYAKREVKK